MKAKNRAPAALSKSTRLFLITATSMLLLTACATKVAREPALGWAYKRDSGVGVDDGPMALYGPPYTLAFLALGCDRSAAVFALEFATIESDVFEGTRLITIEAGGATWTGAERLDPPDAVPIARAAIPLDHPLVDALEREATPILVRAGSGQLASLPNHAVIRRVIRECRERQQLDRR